VKHNGIELVPEEFEFIDDRRQQAVDNLVFAIGNNYYINIDKDILEPHKYRPIYKVLLEATPNNTIFWNINTTGGLLSTTIQLIDYIDSCKCKNIAKVYTSFSAGSILCMAMDDLYVSDFAEMMIHSAYMGSSGKVKKAKDYLQFEDKSIENIFKKMYKGFLTPIELDRILNDEEEIWLYSSDIAERWARRKECLESEYKEMYSKLLQENISTLQSQLKEISEQSKPIKKSKLNGNQKTK